MTFLAILSQTVALPRDQCASGFILRTECAIINGSGLFVQLDVIGTEGRMARRAAAVSRNILWLSRAGKCRADRHKLQSGFTLTCAL